MSEASAASVSQFFTNSDFSIHEAADPSQAAKVEDPLLFFNVNETAAWIRTNAFKRVALQFPDSFLHYACFVSEKLVELVGDLKTFVLADTSYRSCCVDFLAAAHARCDALVHYGDACLSSPSTEIPCRFVLGRLPTQIEDCCEQLSSQISGLEQKSAIIISDSAYDYILETLTALMKAKFPEKSFQESRVILNQTKAEKKLVLGREVNEPSGEEGPFIIFIGASSSSLLPIWLMTFPEIDTVVSYDPVEKRSTLERSYSTRQLRKRLFMVEKLKDANSVGLVVGTVGLEGHREAVSRMRALCKAAAKKIYVISVGKVNVPKLSNFSADIDVFVLVSCPFGILLDTSDFYKPVLSLFEAEVALNPSNSWAAGAGWTADFSKFLHDSIGESRDESDMSLLTSKVRAKPTDQLAEDGHLEGGQVALYTAGDYFKQRSWRGLDDSIRTEEETGVTEGRAGIAASYIQEPSK